MDQSFNDQELSDIMKEIEALEDDLKVDGAESEAKTTPVLKELSNLEEEKAVPTAKKTSHEVLPMSKRESIYTSTTTSMDFKVCGNMNLELRFNIGGKSVNLEVTEEGLVIEMEGGMTFKLPVGHKKAS